MSGLEVSVRLNPSFEEWYGARAVVEEELQAIGKALERIRISSQLQDAFTGHLFAVHRQWFEACPSAGEPGLSPGGLEKEDPTNITTRAAAARTLMKPKKTSASCVSTFTQTVDMNGHRLQMNTQGKVDDNNDDISETSVPSSMTCRVEDEESQSDLNTTLEKPSTEKVVSTKSIKLEVSENEPFPDVLLHHNGLENAHYDVDMDSSKEETPSQQIHEEEVPSQPIESGEQSHLERTNTVSDPRVKHERDFQGHCDLRDMAGSSNQATSYQGPLEEIPHDRSDGQLHLERMNKVSYHPIKQENSQGHCDFDMAGSSSEAMSHQEPVEEIPLDRSDVQLRLEGMDKVLDQHIKHEKDSQGHSDIDMAGSTSETMPYQGLVEGIPLDRSDGTNNTIYALNCDVLSQEGVFKDPCLDSYKKVQKTSRTDDGTNNSARDSEVLGPSEVSADQGPTDLDSDRNVEKTSVPDDGTNNASSSLNCDVLTKEASADECITSLDSYKKDGTKNASSTLNCDVLAKEISTDQCLAGLDSYKKGQKNSGSDCKMKFQCSYCSKRYSCMKQYQKHLSTHTCQKPYHCSVCSERFRRKVSFDKHMMKHQGEKKPFKCDHCSYQCNTKQTLTDHTKMRTRAYKCSSSDKICYYKGDMERHEEKPFKCYHCSSKSANKSNCQVHRRRMEKPYKCDYCTYTCATKQCLKTHLRVHATEKPHKCSLCGKRFAQPIHLKRHVRTHNGEKPYSCDICDYRCSDKGNLKRHMGVHTGEKPHECSLCGKRFLNSSNLKVHIRTHTGEKSYSCDICEYRCSQKVHLTRHMRLHTGEKPHHCSLCGKRFLDSDNLKVHIRTHSGEKPYSCDICDFRCSQKGNLKIHMGVHTGEKPHECSLCGKRFLHSSNLKVHTRTHSGEKSYSCDICDYRCSQKGHLTRHMRLHT